MSKREEILAVLLVMCATGWALEYHHSQTALELAALRQDVLEDKRAAQSQVAFLKASDFASLSQQAAHDLAATIQNELGSSMRALPTNPTKKDETP